MAQLDMVLVLRGWYTFSVLVRLLTSAGVAASSLMYTETVTIPAWVKEFTNLEYLYVRLPPPSS